MSHSGSSSRLDLEKEISNARCTTSDQGPGQTLQCIAVHLNNDRINISSKTKQWSQPLWPYVYEMLFLFSCFTKTFRRKLISP